MGVGNLTPEAVALAEQADYYRARAAEYDEWFLRKGRYDRGAEHTQQWKAEAEQVRAQLRATNPMGDVLEFAGGTGLWTQYLAKTAESITVVDASAEMIELNAARNVGQPITWIHANIFEFEPTQMYDFVFFGFWLSHVPSARFADFWNLVRRCLKPSGTVFFVDSVKEPQSTAVDHVLPHEDESETLVRRLNDGREFRIFKLFYEPSDLQARLAALGWDVQVNQTQSFFMYGNGSMMESIRSLD